YEPTKGIGFACCNKKEESYNRQQTDSLFKKRKMSALRLAESIMRLPCFLRYVIFSFEKLHWIHAFDCRENL
ncbi:MAG: hypothetical protein II921_05915, partial [Treponema sp.]|nr:hypothetical protein [Treponema sp.]